MKKKNDKVMLEVDDENLGFEIDRKENAVKKRGFWKKLFGSAMKGSLFASVLVFNCVFGDVFQLQNLSGGGGAAPAPKTVQDAATFVTFITNNKNALPVGVIDPFAAVAVPAQQWQMLGYAIFIPAGGAGPHQIYVAKKRTVISNNQAIIAMNAIAPLVGPVPLIAPNANAAAGALGGGIFNTLLNVDALSHTERQLVVHLLTSLPGGHINPAGGGGDLHIYTGQQPCPNRTDDNQLFPCLEYYVNMANAYQNVNFHIYFPNGVASLNANFICTTTPNPTVNIVGDNRAAFILMDLVAGSILNGYNNFDNNRIRLVQSGGGHILQCSTAANGEWTDVALLTVVAPALAAPGGGAAVPGQIATIAGGAVWQNPTGGVWNQGAANARLQKFVSTLNQGTVLPVLPAGDRDIIFTKVFNFANIGNLFYHTI
ncbi:MAG: hypothetical protein LBD81_00590 [Holosporaceae bacterium]|jgi:hypothetical protein|nr:hypothetical protein [Holosporaceae bacterium]